jgi:hypothetical protein
MIRSKSKPCLAAAGLLLWAGVLPCLAASSTSSAVSDSFTTSVGSVSGSLRNSSDGSSRNNQAAQGDYKIIDVAAAPDRPATLRLSLRAVADDPGTDSELLLDLPQDVAEAAALSKGGVVTVRQRPYGMEFSDGRTRQAFFLVLADDWYRELQTHPVQL